AEDVYKALTGVGFRYIKNHGIPANLVKSRSGCWIDVIPKDGCVIVLIADLMQRWTSDKFQANPHRVVKLPCEPEDMEGGEKSRFSMIYFGNPDYDAMISSIGD
ncbi:unnamed protein product, partial [Owenia fusiformis]